MLRVGHPAGIYCAVECEFCHQCSKITSVILIVFLTTPLNVLAPEDLCLHSSSVDRHCRCHCTLQAPVDPWKDEFLRRQQLLRPMSLLRAVKAAWAVLGYHWETGHTGEPAQVAFPDVTKWADYAQVSLTYLERMISSTLQVNRFKRLPCSSPL